jgi:hypothetical protein
MAFYNDFTSARTTEPDPGSLLAQLQSLDASALVAHVLGTQVYRVKKDTALAARPRHPFAPAR